MNSLDMPAIKLKASGLVEESLNFAEVVLISFVQHHRIPGKKLVVAK